MKYITMESYDGSMSTIRPAKWHENEVISGLKDLIAVVAICLLFLLAVTVL